MSENNVTVQCLLLVVYDEKIPEPLEEVDPLTLLVYALLPHNISTEGIIDETFSQSDIQLIGNKEECPAALIDAAKEKRLELLEIYLVNPFTIPPSEGCALETPQHDPFHINIKSWDFEIVKPLFSEDIKIESKEEKEVDSCAVNFSALDNVNIHVIENILTYGSFFPFRHIYGWSLLHFAAKKGCEPLVKLLIRSNADIEAKTAYNETPLFMAIQEEHESIVNYLLEQGADVNPVMHGEDFEGATPLHIALHKAGAHRGIVTLLLEKGADIDANCVLGSILQLAVKMNPELLSIILNYRPNVNSRINWLAFREALSQNNQEVIDLLADCGFSVTLDSLDTFFHAIALKNVENVKKFVDEGADVNHYCSSHASEFYGMKPLHIASENFQEKVAELLLSHGADITAKSILGTPLFHAVKVLDVNAVKFLLAKGARTQDDPLILHTAVEVKPPVIYYFKLVDSFKCDESEADLNRAKEGKTSSVLVPILDALLKHGASFHADDKNLEKYFMGHAHFGNLEVVEIFLKHIAFETIHLLEGVVRAIFGRSLKTLEFLIKYMGHPVEANPSILKMAHLEANNKAGKESVDIFLPFLNYNYLNLESIAENGIFELYSKLENEPLGGAVLKLYKKRRECLIKHIIKIKAANLQINQIDPPSSFPPWVQDTDGFQSVCESEIERLRKEKIGNSNISFYDFLDSDTDEISCYLRNDSIIDVLKLCGYQEKFPLYSGVIDGQLQKGSYRRSLIKEGILMFNFLFKKSDILPHDVKEFILDFLSNQHLLILNNVCKLPQKENPDISGM